ncbi:MAG: sigma-70 family RNA polymerase sigma factor, partial [Planctomycetaceae bacterium]
LQQRRASKARRRREAKVIRERESFDDGVVAAVERSELLAVLDEELKELPTRYRTPLVLCHLEGKTQHEAAEQLGLSYGTLRRRLDRGRKLLRTQLGRRGVATTSALLALVWKSATAHAATDAAGFVDGVLSATKGGASPVALVQPRVASAGRIPRPAAAKAGSVPVTVYSMLLAAVLVAMTIPPVVSAIVSTTETEPVPAAGVPADPSPSTSADSPGRSA